MLGLRLVDLHQHPVKPKRSLADKAYDADSFRYWLKRRKIEAVIPSIATRCTRIHSIKRPIGAATALQHDMIAMPKIISQAPRTRRHRVSVDLNESPGLIQIQNAMMVARMTADKKLRASLS